MDSRALRPPAALSARGSRAGTVARAATFTRDETCSPTPRADGENRLYLGDNLAVMRALLREGVAPFKLVYVDPPFNSGHAFAEYDDSRSREAWVAMMRPRLEACHALLAEDGALVAEIDDTELGTLLCLLDEVFGAPNRVSTITLVRSAATGHKARNRGPVNVCDYVLVYAKKKPSFVPNALFTRRDGIDRAYRTFLEDPDAAPEAYVFVPLAKAAARALGHGHSSSRAARAAMGPAWDAHVASFARVHARQVVRFAQVRFEAVSREAQAMVLASKAAPERVLRLERKGHSDMLLRGGNRILFLSSKVRPLARNGTIDTSGDAAPVLSEPLTNVWSDVPFQGIAREGSVTFVRNKKPERLLERICALATKPGDRVLDPFLGSGTTAAVAQKMGRAWVGIERGEHGATLALPRLLRVLAREDHTGIPTGNFAGNGGFGVYR